MLKKFKWVLSLRLTSIHNSITKNSEMTNAVVTKKFRFFGENLKT